MKKKKETGKERNKLKEFLLMLQAHHNKKIKEKPKK